MPGDVQLWSSNCDFDFSQMFLLAIVLTNITENLTDGLIVDGKGIEVVEGNAMRVFNDGLPCYILNIALGP